MKAYSIDGRTFHFEGNLDAAQPVGSYVTVDASANGIFLGRILNMSVGPESSSQGTASGHRLAGEGTLLALVDAGALSPMGTTAPFSDASIHPAEPGVVSAHLTASLGNGAPLAIGEVQRQPGVEALLHAKGFGRHTFLCGQSGSGKTYTLGVILERLLLETDIDLIVLDPNSDYVNLDRVAPLNGGAAGEEFRTLADRYSDVTPLVKVIRRDSPDNPLQARFGRLSLEQQTMILGLDPVADAESYNAFIRIVRGFDDPDYGLEDVIEQTRASFEADTRRLGLRIDNLGVADQSIWGASGEPVMEAGKERRILVADLGGLPDATEMSIAAAAVLGYMWENRRDRRPTIIVIDEAHNVSPQNPTSANQALATEHVIRIAGEGRKFGLYLLLSTQRPSKVHQNVISQCDNLLLMRMNSAADIAELAQTFSFVPPALVAQAAQFGLGEGLAAGKIAPDPLLFKSGRRLTLEGGSDVPSTWASRT